MRVEIIARLVLAAGLLAASLPLAACNIVSGAGKDVKAIGQGLSNSAENVRDEFYP